MKRVAFIALGLLLFVGGDDRTEFERLEDRCLTDWAEALHWATARGTRLDYDPQSWRAFHAMYPRTRQMMIAALAALLLLLVICDPGWREGAVKTSALSPFLAFTQEHAHCQGGREYGTTDDGLRWAACPCGGYRDDRLDAPWGWGWLARLLFTLGRWSVRLEATLWVPVFQAARRISTWRRIALGWLRRQLALLGAR